MARGKAKKPSEPKCRHCGGLLEGKPWIKIGGHKWHEDCAVKEKKYIPVEYRKSE